MRMLVYCLSGLAACAGLAATASAVTIDWVAIGNPGNAPDDTGFGSVADRYRIARAEVTNDQYVEFLNAVAAADPNELYHVNMAALVGPTYGGIARSGAPGSFSYSALPGRGGLPVNWVSFYDSLRFANWLHNGQPSGAQGSATTEAGAYTITAQGIVDNSIARSPGAQIFLANRDEWYKAAYYAAVSSSYFEYPAGFEAQPSCSSPNAGANQANCDFVHADAADVGSYPGSPSPYGTFDQGGNAFEWNEAILDGGAARGVFGGSFLTEAPFMSASQAAGVPSGSTTYNNAAAPTDHFADTGIRLAAVPEPGTGLLLATGLLGLALRRRSHGASDA